MSAGEVSRRRPTAVAIKHFGQMQQQLRCSIHSWVEGSLRSLNFSVIAAMSNVPCSKAGALADSFAQEQDCRYLPNLHETGLDALLLHAYLRQDFLDSS